MSGSESEDFGSAKGDEDAVNGSDVKSSESSSEDEPLSKKKGPTKKKAAAKKSPKKKSPQKKSNKKGAGKAKGRGRPPKQTEKNGDPLAEDSGAEDEPEEEYEVESIVGHREYNGKLVYKIRWKNYEPIHDTWEAHDSLSCPDLLEAYNVKNKVTIPKKSAGKKRKQPSTPKKRGVKPKRRNSLSTDEEQWEGDGESEDEYEVEKIIEVRTKKDGSREFLVHWKRWSADHDTWEPEKNLSCPELIERFMKRVNDAKNADYKELRVNRKHTERFTLNTHENGRRLSRRHNNKQRVNYFDAEGEESD